METARIIDRFSELTDGRFNLEIEVKPDQSSDEMNEQKYSYYGYYVFGEPQRFKHNGDFDLALYREYEKMGMFEQADD